MISSRSSRISKAVLALALAALAGALAAPMGRAQSAEQDTRIAQIFDEIGKAPPAQFWAEAQKLDGLGKPAFAAVLKGLGHSDPKARLAAARVLYLEYSRKAEAANAILAVAAAETGETRVLAAGLLAGLTTKDQGFGDPEAIEKALLDIADKTPEAAVQISLCRAMHAVTGSSLRAVDVLKGMIGSNDSEVREEAALALAEMDHFEPAMDVLRSLRVLQTPRGRLAQSLLKNKQLQDAMMRKGPGDGKYKVLDEMIKKITEQHVEGDKVLLSDMVKAAAKGIGDSLDEFSTFLDEKERKQLNESINLRYGGIGAHVRIRDKWLTIERPIYSGPAYSTGLRSGDQVVKVEGEWTYAKSVDELVGKLKGEPGTAVNITVRRRGWEKDRDFTITRARIEVPTAKYEILPGPIGYIQVSSFGEDTAQEVSDALAQIQQAGCKGLVMDVRSNPGGFLKAACDLVDLFLPAGKTVVTTKAQGGALLDTMATQDPDEIKLPLVVLINDGSASASEIFAGAMQDYQKAALIGERSYGKGSVQNLFDLASTGGKCAFRLTIAKYFLPGGRCIHRLEKDKPESGGILPDIEQPLAERDFWKEFQYAKILDSGLLDKYLVAHLAANKPLMTALADDDNSDPEKYPDYDALYASLQTKLDKEDVRELLRDGLRRRVSDERKKEFITDLQLDLQLQRAIVEIAKKAGMDLLSLPVYKPLAHKFDKPTRDPRLPPEPESPTGNDPGNDETH